MLRNVILNGSIFKEQSSRFIASRFKKKYHFSLFAMILKKSVIFDNYYFIHQVAAILDLKRNRERTLFL